MDDPALISCVYAGDGAPVMHQRLFHRRRSACLLQKPAQMTDSLITWSGLSKNQVGLIIHGSPQNVPLSYFLVDFYTDADVA